MPPGKNMDDKLTMFRSGMWRLNHKLSKEGKFRFHDEFLPLLHQTKEEVLGNLDNDSWYLVYIGTKPEAQGRGYARMLIEYVTRMVSNPCAASTRLNVEAVMTSIGVVLT